jgi:hypothetical protein
MPIFANVLFCSEYVKYIEADSWTIRNADARTAGIPRARCCRQNIDKLIGIRVWQRLQEYAIHDTKDCSVGADSNGQRQQGKDGECRIMQQSPQPVLQRVHIGATTFRVES